MVRSKVPGSGMKKGYKFWGGMSDSNKQAISEALMGREIPWSDRITKHYAENPEKASQRNTESWKTTRHHTYLVISPNNSVYKTINMKQFCLEHGLDPSKMCLVAQGKRKHHKGWRCEYIERYDPKYKKNYGGSQ